MGKYILVVDDEVHIRNLLTEVLAGAGYMSKQAGNGNDCLAYALSENKPSLIILDNHMPMISGLVVLELLNKIEHTKDIPVIMMSSGDIFEQAMKHGAQGVLMKPFDIDELTDKVETILASIPTSY